MISTITVLALALAAQAAPTGNVIGSMYKLNAPSLNAAEYAGHSEAPSCKSPRISKNPRVLSNSQALPKDIDIQKTFYLNISCLTPILKKLLLLLS
jgi:hypothetical protein